MKLLKRLQKSNKVSFLALFLILIAIQLTALIDNPDPSAFFIFLGAAAACAICLGPVIWIRITKFKTKSAKPKFVEPNPFGLFVFVYLPTIATSILLSMMGIRMLRPGVFDDSTNLETFLAAFAFFFGFLLPIAAYTCWMYIFHKRIVEFNSSEWRRLKGR